MAPRSDIQLWRRNWQARVQKANQLGLPSTSWRTLMKRDYDSITQNGSAPMDDKSVNDALLASYHASPIKSPQPSGGGLLDAISNIPGDIQNIASSFIPGTVQYLTTLPEQAQKLANVQFTSEWHSPAQAAKNVSELPVIGPLLPGVATAANFAPGGGGWGAVAQHPVSTALDVGALASVVGKSGLLGTSAARAAENAALESGATRAEAFRAGAETAPKTATEAFRQGQPYKAIGRGIIGPGADVFTGAKPEGLRAPLRKGFESAGERLSISGPAQRVARRLGEIQNEQQVRMSEFQNSPLMKTLTKKLGKADRELLGRVAMRVEQPGDTELFRSKPELTDLLEQARTEVDRLAKENPNLVDIQMPWGRTVKYHKYSPVGRAQTRLDTLTNIAQEYSARAAEARKIAQSYLDRFDLTDPRAGDAIALAKKLNDRVNKANKDIIKVKARLGEALGANAPANYWAMLGKNIRERGIQWAQESGNFTSTELPNVISQITNSATWDEFRTHLGDTNAADRIAKEVESSWQDIARADIHAGNPEPIFIPNVQESRVKATPYPVVNADVRQVRPNVSKHVEFNLSRSVYDVAIGLTENQRQLLEEWGTNQFVNDVLRPDHINDPTGLIRTETSVRDEIRKAILNGRTGAVDVRSQIQAEVDRNYRIWTKHEGLRSYFTSVSKTGDDTLLIPIGIDRSLTYLGFQHAYGPLQAAFDKATGLWRFAVLTTPRHISHVVLGGMTMGLLQYPGYTLEIVKDLRGALDMVRGKGPRELRALFGRNLNEFSPDQIVLYAGGKTMGRMLNQLVRPAKWINRYEENVTYMYKVMMMRHLESRVGIDEAMRLANKVFVDVNAMTPLERYIFKKVFPFYGFTRHVMRYALTYPADHPLRMSILSNFSNQQQRDWDTGMPQALQWMFYLGPPDRDGNQSAIDYRSIDPFRSFYNNFTWAGLSSQAHPAIQFVAAQMGINTLSATPELYPGRHIDAVTGQFVADRPSGLALTALESLIPQTQAADALFELSDQFRNLKITDPEQYKHRVYTALGIPFGPETINKTRKRQNYQLKLYQDASDSINTAVRTGDFKKAFRYSYVPIPSMLQRYFGNMVYATPQQVQAVYNTLKDRLAPNTSLHAVLPRYTPRRKKK